MMLPWTALATAAGTRSSSPGSQIGSDPDSGKNARCCGTAGVLALACDRIVERGDDSASRPRGTVAMIELWPSVGGEWRLGP